MNRRGFGGSLAAVACAGFGPAFAGIADPGIATHFVHDSRLATVTAIDWVARIRPTQRHAFNGDVTGLWRDVLRAIWRDTHAPTAGVTRHAEFFVLATLARDHGYRVAASDEQAQHVCWLLVSD